MLIEESIVDSNLDRFLKYLSNLKEVQFNKLTPQYQEEIKERSGKEAKRKQNSKPLRYLDSARISQEELITRTIVSLLKN